MPAVMKNSLMNQHQTNFLMSLSSNPIVPSASTLPTKYSAVPSPLRPGKRKSFLNNYDPVGRPKVEPWVFQKLSLAATFHLLIFLGPCPMLCAVPKTNDFDDW